MFLNCGVGEDSWESLGSKEIKPVSPKGNQSWIFIGRTDAEAEIVILWRPDVKKQLIGKDPDAGKDWRQEEKGTTEDEMVGWHHLLKGHEFERALGVGEGPGSLVCCSPRGSQRGGYDWGTAPNWIEGPAWKSTLALPPSFPVLFLPGPLSCSLNLLLCSFCCLKPPDLSVCTQVPPTSPPSSPTQALLPGLNSV